MIASDRVGLIAAGFSDAMKRVYADRLVSVIMYGSAASGEYALKSSDINMLVVLDGAGLDAIAKSSRAMTARKFKDIVALFFDESYIGKTTDVFPIEFLDMKDSYKVLYGKDVLKDLKVDPKHLRFQCEQEIKSRIITIKKAYPRIVARSGTRAILFKTFSSVLPIIRNTIRLKGETPPYRKEDVIKVASSQFGIDSRVFMRILEAKRRNEALGFREADGLLCEFTKELERLADAVDKL